VFRAPAKKLFTTEDTEDTEEHMSFSVSLYDLWGESISIADALATT
jgi:hypothetical protein